MRFKFLLSLYIRNSYNDFMGVIKVVCGAIVFKEDRFVLVKEAQPHVYGKWSYPVGHLELDEDIIAATTREVKEETNLDVKLEGLIGVYEHNRNGNNAIKFVFKASVIGGELKHQETELLDARWFSMEELDRLKDEELRMFDLRKTIVDCNSRELIPLDRVNIDFIALDTKDLK